MNPRVKVVTPNPDDTINLIFDNNEAKLIIENNSLFQDNQKMFLLKLNNEK